MSNIPVKMPEQTYIQDATIPMQDNNYLLKKRQNFTRSTSIDRIIQFNSYICTQNFYILPSLIAWFKSSQTVVQLQLERCIALLKTIFIISIIQGIIVNQLKRFALFIKDKVQNYFRKACDSGIAAMLEISLFIFYQFTRSVVESVMAKLFVFCIYFTFVMIFVQLGTCIFFMSSYYLPAGLIFLFVCMYVISHVHIQVSLYYIKKRKSRSKPLTNNRKVITENKTKIMFNSF